MNSSQPLLPQLNLTSLAHPDSCLSLSTRLLTLLCSLVPLHNPKLLSIGSGTGLLEILLAHHRAGLIVHGLEPQPGTANIYLEVPTPDSQTNSQLKLVPGTWAIYQQSLDYGTWLFVYPRDPNLVERYLRLLCTDDASRQTRVIVWAGPRVDWEEFYRSIFSITTFSRQQVYLGEEAGVAAWELVVANVYEGDGQTELSTASLVDLKRISIDDL